MAFTLITLTFSPPAQSSSPSQGRVTATLSEPVQNGTTVYSTSPFVGFFSDAGALVDDDGDALQVPALDDPGTEPPTGPFYTFVIEQDSARVRQFEALISHLAPGGTVDLSSLEPVAP